MSIVTITPDTSGWFNSKACVPWCEEHGIDAAWTFQLDFDFEHNAVTVHQWALNAQGQPFAAPGTLPGLLFPSQAARREPFTVWVKRWPSPEELMAADATALGALTARVEELKAYRQRYDDLHALVLPFVKRFADEHSADADADADADTDTDTD